MFPEVCEAGTTNVPGLMGLRAGIEWLMKTGQEEVWQKLSTLRERFVSGVTKIPGVQLYGSSKLDAGPVVSINIDSIPAAVLGDALNQEYGIATRASHCAPLMHRRWAQCSRELFGLVSPASMRLISDCALEGWQVPVQLV